MRFFLFTLSIFSSLSVGCTGTLQPLSPEIRTPNTIPQVTRTNARAEAFIEIAQTETRATKPHSDALGNVHLDTAIKALTSSLVEVGQTTTELTAVQHERDTLILNFQNLTSTAKANQTILLERITVVERSIGYRAEKIIRRIIFWFVVLCLFHWIVGFVAKWVPSPYDWILGTTAYWVDPVGWIESGASKLHYHELPTVSSR